jgi:GT2 family glycosyltransferase
LYWEETDWCYRAKQRGFGLYACPGAICYDKISTVIGKNFMAHYYYARNGLLFVSKFRKKNMPLVLGIMLIRFLKRSVNGQWGPARGILAGTRDFFKSKWYAAE